MAVRAELHLVAVAIQAGVTAATGVARRAVCKGDAAVLGGGSGGGAERGVRKHCMQGAREAQLGAAGRRPLAGQEGLARPGRNAQCAGEATPLRRLRHPGISLQLGRRPGGRRGARGRAERCSGNAGVRWAGRTGRTTVPCCPLPTDHRRALHSRAQWIPYSAAARGLWRPRAQVERTPHRTQTPRHPDTHAGTPTAPPGPGCPLCRPARSPSIPCPPPGGPRRTSARPAAAQRATGPNAWPFGTRRRNFACGFVWFRCSASSGRAGRRCVGRRGGGHRPPAHRHGRTAQRVTLKLCGAT